MLHGLSAFRVYGETCETFDQKTEVCTRHKPLEGVFFPESPL